MNFEEHNKDYKESSQAESEVTNPQQEISGGDVSAKDVTHKTSSKKKGKEKKKKTWQQELLEWVYCLGIAVLVAFLLITFVGQIVDVSGSSMCPTLENGDKLIIYKLGYTPQKGDIVVFDPKGDTKPYIKRVIATPGDTVDILVDNETKFYNVYVNGVRFPEPYISTNIQDDSFATPRAVRMEFDPEGKCYNVYYNGVKLEDSYTFEGMDTENPDITQKDTVVLERNPLIKYYDVYVNDSKLEESYIAEKIDQGHLRNFQGPQTVPEGHVFVLGDNRNHSEDSRNATMVGMVSYDSIKGKAIFRIWPFNRIGFIY